MSGPWRASRLAATRARRRGIRPAACAAAAVCAAAAAGGCGGPWDAGDARDRPPPVLRVTVASGGLVPEVATGIATGGGRVLTVAHALAGRHAIRAGGRQARVLRIDRRLDLALLAVPGLRAPAVRFGDDARRVRLVVVRGARPRSLRGEIRRRVTVAFREQPSDPPRIRPGIEIAAAIDPGDSGAPVLDGRGRLLGVLYARSRDRAATAWAVDASAVRVLLGR